MQNFDGMGRPAGPNHPGYMALPASDRIGVARYYDDYLRQRIVGKPELSMWLNWHPSNFNILMDCYVQERRLTRGKNEDGQPVFLFSRQAAFIAASEAWRLTERVYGIRPAPPHADGI